MEKELNIAAILKDKPQGTKLYDLLHNVDVELDTISTTDTETVVWCTNETDNNTTCHRGYSEFGTIRGCPDGLQILLPSKEMRDWRKFDWKKGDVLTDGWGSYSIFIEFDQGTGYANVVLDFLCDLGNAKINHDIGQISYPISDWRKASNEKAKEVISHIEKFFGGKLNLDTLEIEKQPKQEFKDGDIVHIPAGYITEEAIFIAKVEAKGVLHSYVYMSKDSMIPLAKSSFSVSGCLDSLRIATDTEKKQLFDALAKKNKAWDAKHKTIVDLKPKWWTPKPFDRVITRGDNNDIWTANIFSHMNSYGEYVAIGCVGGYHYCLPYNDETAHLIGTTYEWKGGEG